MTEYEDWAGVVRGEHGLIRSDKHAWISRLCRQVLAWQSFYHHWYALDARVQIGPLGLSLLLDCLSDIQLHLVVHISCKCKLDVSASRHLVLALFDLLDFV